MGVVINLSTLSTTTTTIFNYKSTTQKENPLKQILALFSPSIYNAIK